MSSRAEQAPVGLSNSISSRAELGPVSSRAEQAPVKLSNSISSRAEQGPVSGSRADQTCRAGLSKGLFPAAGLTKYVKQG